MPTLTHCRTFHLRTYRRVPVQGTVEFLNEDLHGTGQVWNVSLKGCRVDAHCELARGTALSLCLNLSNTEQHLVVDTAVVAWTRGCEVGLRFKNVDASQSARLQQIIRDRPHRTPISRRMSPGL